MNRIFRLGLLLAGLGGSVAFWPSIAEAQIVNVLSMAGEGQGFSGAVNGAVDWRSGNVDSTRATADLMLSLRGDRDLVFLVTRGDLGIKSDALYLAKSFEHLRYRRAIGGRWSSEVFAQHTFDKFQKLQFRLLGGLGLRFDVVEWQGGAVAVGTAYMPELERLNEGVEDGAGTFFHRWSSYFTFSAQLGEPFVVNSVTYAQPRVDQFSDYRISHEFSFRIQVQDVVVSPFTFSLQYDSRPPQGVEELDLGIRSTLGLRF